MRAIEINLIGSVLAGARRCSRHLRQSDGGKIVQLSGGGATRRCRCCRAYAASKAAVVRFAETLAHEVADDGIDVNAIAPGALNTGMLDEVLAAGPEAVGETFYAARASSSATNGGTPSKRGADLAVYLASRRSDGITGRLLSAVWDPWESSSSAPRLAETDIYTLRRIVPAERGEGWGD